MRPGEKLYEEILINEEGLGKTDHIKIYIERPKKFSFKAIKQQINELMDTVIVGNEDMLREKFKDLVPGYKKAK